MSALAAGRVDAEAIKSTMISCLCGLSESLSRVVILFLADIELGT